jgi:hypothetical protein
VNDIKGPFQVNWHNGGINLLGLLGTRTLRF